MPVLVTGGMRGGACGVCCWPPSHWQWPSPSCRPWLSPKAIIASPILGLPNFLNVVSNLPFLLMAMRGLATLRRPRPGAFVKGRERLPWAVFFLGLAATGFGSAWYHLAPNNAVLFWDRLPLSLCFGALIAERVSIRAELARLVPLAASGTVLHWPGEPKTCRPIALFRPGRSWPLCS
ncbi:MULTISPECIES: hypothetical protein [Methylococcus]|uniref:Ceramidase n=1 Tax=Methylococcus capsulatus TaxID=414 RepID=A0ABZ2F859_METCP|nr:MULTISPECIES: hypothetical protein [Methylococcus]MDF9391113.1 hypothetical protein [Methylococcus capsulatus]